MRLNLFPSPPKEPPNWRDWKSWFAWRPVIIDDHLVWLERVECRPSGFYPPTLAFPHEYRFRPEK